MHNAIQYFDYDNNDNNINLKCSGKTIYILQKSIWEKCWITKKKEQHRNSVELNWIKKTNKYVQIIIHA